RPAVTPVRAVRLVPEPAHQGVVCLGDSCHRPALTDERSAKPEAGHGWNDDVEGVLGSSAMSYRIGKRTDHVKELRERPWIGVRQQQRSRPRLRGSNVHKVNGLTVDFGDKVGDRVHPSLLRSPVELLPRGHHLLEVGDRGSVVPTVIGCRNRKASVGEAAPKVLECVLWNRDREWTDDAGLAGGFCGCHASTLESI